MIAARHAIVTVLTSVLLLGSACQSPAPPQRPSQAPAGAAALPAPDAPPPPTPEPALVRVGVLNSVGDAPFSIGIEQGYYAEQGITIETITFDSAARMMAPMAAGQLDVGQGIINAGAFNAVARGAGLKGIASATGSVPGHSATAYILRKDAVDEIRGPADLRGRKLAMPSLGTGTEIELVELLRRGGLTLADVDIAQLNFGEQVIALGNGAIDLAVLSEPAATLALDRGVGELWMRADAIIPNHLTSLIWAAPQFVAQRDVAQRFMVAALKSVRLYNDAFVKRDPRAREQVIDVFLKYTPVKERDLYDRMVFQYLDPDGRINRESVANDLAYYLAAGHVTGPVDVDGLLDTRFTDYAVGVLGPYPR